MIIDAHDHLFLAHVRTKTEVFPAVRASDMLTQMRQGGVAAVGLVVGGTLSFPHRDASSSWIGTLDGLGRFWRGIPQSDVDMVVIRRSADLDLINEAHPGVLLGIEGWDPCLDAPFDDPVLALHLLFQLGVRSFQPLGNRSHAGFQTSPDDAMLHLSPVGRQLVQTSGQCGMVIDVAHFTGDEPAFHEIISLSVSAPIASHHSCRAVSRLPEALSDDAIRAIASAGGVIAIHAGSPTLRPAGGQASLRDIAAHVRHVMDLVGIDHVGIGTDFMDVRAHPRDLPDTLFAAGLGGVHDIAKLGDTLLRSGFSNDECEAVLGKNVLRVWRSALAASTW